MTKKQAEDALAKYGSQRRAAAALHVRRQTIREAMLGDDDVAPTDATRQEAQPSIGILLSNARMSDHKPADTVKRLLYQLKKGRGFPLDKLAGEWNISIDKVRREARRFDCMKYVEVEPGNWVLCVLHPETAEEYRRGEK